jgi:protein farnesyltransferase subunit beta
MRYPIKGTKHRHKVRFETRAMAASSSQVDSSASSRFEELLDDASPPNQPQPASSFIIRELPSDSDQPTDRFWADMPAAAIIPDLFTSWPPIRDSLETESSQLQDETIEEILPFLSGTSKEFKSYNAYGIPHLIREKHIRFLHKCIGPLPEPYRGADAGRPWFFYWSICALCSLGEDVTSFRKPLISTVKWMQNESGGFAGGQGQMSHLAPTYAVVLALSMVGGDEALDLIDRKAMWQWLGILKQADGGFQMSIGGEEDVRYPSTRPCFHLTTTDSFYLEVFTVLPLS